MYNIYFKKWQIFSDFNAWLFIIFDCFFIIKFSAFCRKATYNVLLQSYDRRSYIDIQGESKDKTSDNKSSRVVYLYYSTTDINVSTTSKLITLSSFISEIGGNLGLFIGFSFMHMFFVVFQYLKRCFHPRTQDICV